MGRAGAARRIIQRNLTISPIGGPAAEAAVVRTALASLDRAAAVIDPAAARQVAAPQANWRGLAGGMERGAAVIRARGRDPFLETDAGLALRGLLRTRFRREKRLTERNGGRPVYIVDIGGVALPLLPGLPHAVLAIVRVPTQVAGLTVLEWRVSKNAARDGLVELHETLVDFYYRAEAYGRTPRDARTLYQYRPVSPPVQRAEPLRSPAK